MSGPRLTDFVELEERVWDALVAGDADADAAMLADDFLGVYPTGFAGRSDHAAQLRDGPTVAHFELHDARLLVVSDETVMLAYRADFTRPGAASPESMYVSSLWCRRDERWVNVFSQDTPADPRRAVP